MPSVKASDRILVLDYVVFPATNEIAKGETITRIEPKSMEVLVHLLEHAGEVVSRDALQDAIWGDVIVGDDSLTNAIIKLRKAFADDARNPRLIETIPKRGYRLIAEVSKSPAAGRTLPTRHNLAARVVIAVFVAGLAMGWLLWERSEPVVSPLPAPDGRTRVAVATFQNLSGDPTQDYLSLGVEQTLLAGLAGIPQIAAMHASDETSAGYRLEGSVHRNGDTIRVDTLLLDNATGVILSTQRYERAFSDLLTIQAEIEGDVLTALALDIDQAHRTAEARGLTESIDAYDLFLQARAALLPRDRAGNDRARALYQRAIARDPNFARAYGGLALSYAAEYRNGWSVNGPEALERAMSMAETALSIQPSLPAQHWVIGYVQTQKRNLPDAMAALETALQLDPGYADAYALLGGVHTYAGEPGKTIPLLREAMRLRPDAGYLYFMLLGRAYYFLDDCEQALINLTAAAERNPANLETHIYLAGCLAHQENRDGAEWEVLEILGIDPNFTVARFFETYPMTAEDQIATLSADLRLAGAE